MLNNESWLMHSDLFENNWIIEQKSWVRTLGWFTDFIHTARDAKGWVQAGDRELSLQDYLNIIDDVSSEKKLFCFDNSKWIHISGPVIFSIKQTDDLVFIAGWAGEKSVIDEYKMNYDSPWDWPVKHIIEVDPVGVIHTVRGKNYNKKEIPVFFASNGESNANRNWKHLVEIYPKAIRVDGIDGRRNMFLRCVDLTKTGDHFFVVTGKNYVTDISVFDYVPEVTNAHIVFNSKNMSNRLEYGHMGIVCYNKNLVLNTPEDFGLDFTSYSPIHSVPRTASEGIFATSEYEAWRTAFRETVKLTLRFDQNSQYWLSRWLAFAEGDNAFWVLKGARDGHDYAVKHKDSPEQLKKTVDWKWLSQYYEDNK